MCHHRQKQHEKEIQTKFEREHSRCVKAAEAFMKVMIIWLTNL